MSFIDNFRRYFPTRNVSIESIRGASSHSRLSGAKPIKLSLDNADEVFKCFSTNPYLFCAIDKIGQLVSNGKWIHRDSNGDIIESSDILDLLSSPHPLFTGKELIHNLTIYTKLFGDGILLANRTSLSSLPYNLLPLNSSKIEVVTTGKFFTAEKMSDVIQQYTYRQGSKKIEFNENQLIIHLKDGISQEGINSMSRIKTLGMEISNLKLIGETSNSFMQDRGASGMISMDSKDELGGMQSKGLGKEEIEEQLEDRYGIGTSKSGKKKRKTIVTSHPFKYTQMGYDLKSLLLDETASRDFRTICNTFGYSIDVFGDKVGATYENKREATINAYNDVAIPFAESIAQSLSDLLEEDLKLDFSHIPQLGKDKEKISNISKNNIATLSEAYNLVQSGGISLQEYQDLKKRIL